MGKKKWLTRPTTASKRAPQEPESENPVMSEESAPPPIEELLEGEAPPPANGAANTLPLDTSSELQDPVEATEDDFTVDAPEEPESKRKRKKVSLSEEEKLKQAAGLWQMLDLFFCMRAEKSGCPRAAVALNHDEINLLATRTVPFIKNHIDPRTALISAIALVYLPKLRTVSAYRKQQEHPLN